VKRVATYNPQEHEYIDEAGNIYDFYAGTSEFPDEAMTLIRFKEGSLTLQEAYSIILNLARVPKNKFTQSEFFGDACVILGAGTLEGLQQLQNLNNQEIKIDQTNE
jgi:hypothetical protein